MKIIKLLKTSKAVSIIIFLVVFITFSFLAKSYSHRICAFGDEPHYLIITQSLINDHDIDLGNNYQNKDYNQYYPGEIDPHIHSLSRYGGSFPVGGIGLPLLLVPFFFLGGRVGTIILFNLISALLAANIFLLFWQKIRNKRLAVVLTLVAIFTLPLSIYSFQIFPELIAALIIIYIFRRLPQSFWAVLPLALLPWLHYKYIFVVLVFVIYLIIKKKYYYLIPIIISLLGFVIYNKYFYGNFLGTEPLFNSNAWVFSNSILALFLDRQRGLLAWAPIYIIFLISVFGWWKYDKKTILEKKYLWLAIVLVIILPVVFFKYWHGGFVPMGRYLVPLLPLFWLPIVFLLNRFRNLLSYFFFGALAGVSLFLSWLGMTAPIILYPRDDFYNSVIYKLGAMNIFPSFLRSAPIDWFLFSFWFILIIGFSVLLTLKLKKEASS